MQVPISLEPGLHPGDIETASVAYVIAGVEDVEIDKLINNYRAWPRQEKSPFEGNVCRGT
jgi:hypothetical protein